MNSKQRIGHFLTSIKSINLFGPISGVKFSLLMTLFFTLVFNARIWQLYNATHEISGVSDFFQLISFFLFVFFILGTLFSLFNFLIVQKIFFVICILISAPAMYFAVWQGIQFDQTMIQNVLETDTREAFDLITLSFATVVLLVGVIPAIVVIRVKPIYYPPLKQVLVNAAMVVLFPILAFISVYPFYAELSSFVRNNNILLTNSLLPTAPIRSTYKNLVASHQEKQIVKEILDPSANRMISTEKKGQKPVVLVVMIGETAREKSFGLHDRGMSEVKETLIGRKNSIYFSNFWSCGTNTALSVPCMFSLYPKDEYKRSMNSQYENVAEIINRVGYDTVWRNNNSGCKGICKHLKQDPINQENSAKFAHDGEFYDQALVEHLASRIRAKKVDQVIYLHMMGSHGPAYYKRAPDQYKLLKPACHSADFAVCDDMEIINAYNNTILYTKAVIGNAIDALESLEPDYAPILYYNSDHGESTGEKGMYLHGVPYFMAPDEQTHIPALLWVSDEAAAQKGINLECMKAKQKQRHSHDNLSHTLLGVLDIQTIVYDKDLDLFDGCRHAIN